MTFESWGETRDRRGPPEAVLHVDRPVPRGVLDVGPDHPGLAGPVVVPGDDAGVLAGINHVGLGRVGRRVAGLAAAHVVPVRERDAVGRQAVARPRDRAQVLHGPRDVVRLARVDVDPVELADRQRRPVPRGPAAGADLDPAVMAGDHPAGVGRVDPDVVVVAVVEARHALEGLAAVDAPEHRDIRAPDDVGVMRVHDDRRIVPGALAQQPVARRQRPRPAAVIRPEQSPLVGLDDRVNPPPIRRRHGHTDLAPGSRRQAMAVDRLPGRAAIPRDVQPAARPAAGQLPGRACACHNPAKTMFGLDGSKATSDPPVSASFLRTAVQDLPPSVVR